MNIESHLIVVANQRLARDLPIRLAKGDTRLKFLERLNTSYNVITFSQFVKEMWWFFQANNCQELSKRISTKSEQLSTWRHVVSRHASTLIHQSALIKNLEEARQIIHNWQIPQSKINDAANEESILFSTLFGEFKRILLHNQLITPEAACENLLDTSAKLPTYSTIASYGFTSLSPLESALLQKCCSTGDIHELSIDNNNDEIAFASSSLTCFNSIQQELTSAAQQALRHNTENPEQRIGVVVPDLHKHKHLVERVFEEVFIESSFLRLTTDTKQRGFDISLGESLIQQPIVDTLFSLLVLRSRKLQLDQFSLLLESPFWNTPSPNETAAIQEWISAYPSRSIPVSLLVEKISKLAHPRLLHREMENPTPDIAQQILALQSAVRQFKGMRTFSEWTHWLKSQLKSFGWPGNQTLNSNEYQACKALFKVFTEIQKNDTLSIFSEGVELTDFIEELKIACTNAVFHAEVATSNVQIMGLIEGAGLLFDKCIITGLNASVLPATPRPNPFISLQVQQHYQTPRSDFTHEFDYSKKLLQLYLQASSETDISFFENDGANQHIASPIVLRTQHTPSEKEIVQPQKNDFLNLALTQARTKSKDDHSVDFNIHSHYQNKLPGGTGFLQAYAENPLIAYLRFMLNIKAPENKQVSISAKVRGITIHETLFQLYKLYSSQSDIAAFLQTPNPNTPIIKIVREQLQHQLNSEYIDLPYEFIELEAIQLTQAVSDFLENEVKRESFEIASLEAFTSYVLDPFTLSMRIDRIDNIDGKHLIIDYKTGKNSVNSLLTAPLREPQLALYLLANQQENLMIDGVAYFNISAKDISISGVTNDELLKQIKISEKLNGNQGRSWHELIAYWEQQLRLEADSIAQCRFPNLWRNKSAKAYHDALLPITKG